MRLSVIVLSLTAAVAAVAPAADAAPKKKKKPAVCRLAFTDPRADTVFGPAPGGESFDILGGDLTNRPTELVATLKVATAPTAGALDPAGQWTVGVGANGAPVEFALRRAAGGALSSSVTIGGQPMSHRYSLSPGTIVWTALKKDSPLMGRSLTFTMPNAASKLAAVTADAASATASKKCG